jgi:hypothetical protein
MSAGALLRLQPGKWPREIVASDFSLLRQQDAQSGILLSAPLSSAGGVRKFRSSLKDGMERCSKETEND